MGWHHQKQLLSGAAADAIRPALWPPCSCRLRSPCAAVRSPPTHRSSRPPRRVSEGPARERLAAAVVVRASWPNGWRRHRPASSGPSVCFRCRCRASGAARGSSFPPRGREQSLGVLAPSPAPAARRWRTVDASAVDGSSGPISGDRISTQTYAPPAKGRAADLARPRCRGARGARLPARDTRGARSPARHSRHAPPGKRGAGLSLPFRRAASRSGEDSPSRRRRSRPRPDRRRDDLFPLRFLDRSAARLSVRVQRRVRAVGHSSSSCRGKSCSDRGEPRRAQDADSRERREERATSCFVCRSAARAYAPAASGPRPGL